MLASIVVPAHNAGADLGACLEAILGQLPDDCEVVVVDDGSEDGTALIAAEIAAKAGVKVLRHERAFGPAAARNAGVAASTGEILIFLDADVEAGPGAVAALLGRLRSDRGLDAVMGSYDDAPLHPSLVSQFRNLLHHYVHQHARRDAVTFWTGCGAMRRAAFVRAGGFNPARRWLEDVDLGLRLSGLGGRIALDPAIQVKHRKRWTLGSMLRTDIFGRAVPWMELMEGRDGLRDDLNTRWRDRWSAVGVCAGVGMLLLGRWEGVLGIGLATALSWPWHAFLWRKRGLGFAMAAAPLHWLYLGYSAATYAVMLVLLKFRRRA